ncbi:MAG: LacI family DNA-binding transcriptional regulator [Rhodobacteraceae bacterium]|nr:LacI family DNA-binding transcriptional regulator [Paracoccaceae bacterium]
MSKRPTIIDVAKAAGVSKSTVSLVLQNSSSVKAETRTQVLQAIKDTRYVYNRAAANLRGAGAGLVGLIINDLRNPYYTELATSVQMKFAERGYATAIGNSDEDPELQAQLITSMIEHGVSALMIAPAYGGDDAPFKDIQQAGIPTVQVLRSLSGGAVSFPLFSMDYMTGGLLAADHMLTTWGKGIAFVGGVESREITIERKSGYVKKMRDMGLDPIYFHGESNRTFGYETAIEIAKNHPEIKGIVTFNDLVALGMLGGFAQAGVKVGEDIGIVGFDDIQEASQCYPKLSSVRCDVNAFGQQTVDVLLNWVEKDVRPNDQVRFPVDLVLRASSTRE